MPLGIFGKPRREIIIVGDHGAALEHAKKRIEFFWPPEIKVKIIAVYCVSAVEAVEAVQEYRPALILLHAVFKNDKRTGKDVALWIDRNYKHPILVAAYADLPEEELRKFFDGAQCIHYFIAGDRFRDFVEYCTQKQE